MSLGQHWSDLDLTEKQKKKQKYEHLFIKCSIGMVTGQFHFPTPLINWKFYSSVFYYKIFLKNILKNRENCEKMIFTIRVVLHR